MLSTINLAGLILQACLCFISDGDRVLCSVVEGKKKTIGSKQFVAK